MTDTPVHVPKLPHKLSPKLVIGVVIVGGGIGLYLRKRSASATVDTGAGADTFGTPDTSTLADVNSSTGAYAGGSADANTPTRIGSNEFPQYPMYVGQSWSEYLADYEGWAKINDPDLYSSLVAQFPATGTTSGTTTTTPDPNDVPQGGDANVYVPVLRPAYLNVGTDFWYDASGPGGNTLGGGTGSIGSRTPPAGYYDAGNVTGGHRSA